MSNQLNLPNIPPATSSPESEAGPTRSNSPAGQKIEKSGPEAVRVSRFRALDCKKAMPTKDTCGPLFIGLSPSAVLQRSLESRLRMRLDANGSLEYELTWKELDMPSGPPICALRASRRRKNANVFIGYPTVRASDRGPRNPETAQKKLKQDGRTRHHRIEDLLTALGTRTGYPNPRFLSWMMGFPESWTSLGVLATRSCRNSAPSLSQPSSKPRIIVNALNFREYRTSEMMIYDSKKDEPTP